MRERTGLGVTLDHFDDRTAPSCVLIDLHLIHPHDDFPFASHVHVSANHNVGSEWSHRPHRWL